MRVFKGVDVYDDNPESMSLRLTSAHRSDPMGLPAGRGVMLGWSARGHGELDSSRGVDVVVGDDPEQVAADRGSWRAEGLPGSSVLYAGPRLGSRDTRYWRATAYRPDGSPVTSDIARFEIGLEAQTDWVAPWMSAPLEKFRRETWDPAPLIRTTVQIDGAPARARIYATALGIYRLWVNGTEVTAQDLFRPGWTDFRFRVLHQTYDVASLLVPGENVIGVELARGWYAGRLGLQREWGLYGEQPAVRVQVELDGISAVDGGGWRYSYGDIVATDMLTGESQDLRGAQPGWNDRGFDDGQWMPVQQRTDISTPIVPQVHDSVSTYREHAGVLVRAHARGPAVFDFGQNVVGWTRLSTKTLPKSDLLIRHGEVLTKDDLVWRDNLRGAFQEDRYTTGDSEHHVLEPRFTIHGFRFAEVWGMAPKLPNVALQVRDDTTISAISLSGGQRPVGSFHCSDPELTAVSRLVEWTVRDNFIEVITDCPQRDERLGWLGDAGVIGESAAYHFDIAAFIAKFARDAADSQSPNGSLRSYVPPVPPGIDQDGAPGWADGYVRLVHLAAHRYGDEATAREHYEPIARYLAWVDHANPDGIRTEAVGPDFSDWLSLSEDPNEPPHPGYAYTGARSTSSKRVVATAHTIRSLDQFANIAEWLGKTEDAEGYRARADEVRAAYAATFLNSDGWIEGDTQTVYAQAIGYDILRGRDRQRAIDRLAEKVRELGHVTTGIHGVEHILPALARNGHADLAEMLLMREDLPSWKHMVAMGATTIWEKWDGITAEGERSTAEMNSFNHCALGGIGEFLFETVAGLAVRDASRDHTMLIEPVYFEALEWARAEHESAAGPVASGWSRDGESVTHEISVAPGMTAIYRVPAGYCLPSGDAEMRLPSGAHSLTVTRV